MKETSKKEAGKKVSEKKITTVKKLVGFMEKSKAIIIASIKNLPSSQFQSIRKKLKGKAEVNVVKKRVMWKALESADKNLINLKNYVQEDSAILFSHLDVFELAGFLAENKNPIAARAGQITDIDIEIEEGATDLVPGPAISELGALGIKIAVEEGKIAIKERKVVVKAGEQVTSNAASVLAKLDVRPFYIGLEPIAAYDSKTGKVYTNIRIDKEKTLAEMKTTAAKAMGLARKIAYYCKETIGFLLVRANAQGSVLNKLQTEKIENTEEKKVEGNVQQINIQEEK